MPGPLSRPATRRSTSLRLALGGLAAGAVAAAVALNAAGSGSSPGTNPGTGSGDLGRVAAVAWHTFDDCTALLKYYRSNAVRLVGADGLPGYGGFPLAMEGAGVPEVAARDTAAAAPSAGGSTQTNVQVAGVDEADLVKVNGDLMVTVAEGTLRVLRLTAGGARLIGSLKLPADGWTPAQQLLLEGSTAVVMADGGAGAIPMGARIAPDLAPARQSTRISQVDLSDPQRPRLVRRLDVDGSLVGARLSGGTVRLAIRSGPDQLNWSYPDQGKSTREQAAAANRRVVARSSLDSWLPGYALTSYGRDGATDGIRRGRLLDCADVVAPRTFSGLETLAMLSLDVRDGRPGIGRWSGAGVVAGGSTLYATADHAYVTTSPWIDWAAASNPEALQRATQAQRTQVHLFDTPVATGDGAPPAPVYVASGEVPGSLLGQFALDEYRGVLRVASTTQPVGGEATAGSRSRVTTLRPEGDRLVRVGVVDGLGKGETIRGVRFAGAVGYVVTFRQTDPLYTVDLSDPAAPRVAGELKVLGYSAYLHPLDGGLLLGLGQDGDAGGRLSGLQLSLFDVSDPAAPRRLDRVPLRGAWSDVEGDHHAFTMAGGLALAPFQLWQDPSATTTSVVPAASYDAGVLAVAVEGRRLSEPHTLRPLADGPQQLDVSGSQEQGSQEVLQATPQRTVVREGTVYTLTPVGVAIHDAASFERLGFTRFSR